MSQPTGQIRRVHINSEMDLFEIIRTLIYPILEEKLDVVFPEFGFQKVSNGWWLARTAPVSCHGFGHKNGRLAATQWGFRSLDAETPTVFWLAYVNKMELPDWRGMPEAVRRLAAKVNHHFEWTPEEEAARTARERFRLYHLLDAVLMNSQNVLMGPQGEEAREYLTREIGFPESSLLGMEFGLYDSIREMQNHLKESGFGNDGDLELAGLMGLFQDEWEGRIVGPWRDRLGRCVFNLWGRTLSPLFGGSPGRPLPASTSDPRADRKHRYPVRIEPCAPEQKEASGHGPEPIPFPVAASEEIGQPGLHRLGGKVTAAQVSVLEKYLKNEGSLTLNLDFEPNVTNMQRATLQSLDELEGVSFPVYVVNPEEMSEPDNLVDPVSPDKIILEKGLNAYVDILRKRQDPDDYRRSVGG